MAEARQAVSAPGPRGEQGDQDPTSGFWRFRLSKTFEVCLSYNPGAYRPVVVRATKPFVTFSDQEFSLLLGFLLFAKRFLKRGKGFSYRWTTRVVETTRIPVELRATLGLIERGFKSQRNIDLSLDA